MKLLLKNIKTLLQVEEQPVTWKAGSEMAQVDSLEDAFLLINEGRIEDFGPMKDLPACKGVEEASLLTELDVSDRMVLPAFCDSHTHIVYGGSREQEFVDKIRGLGYEEIAKKGGGILNSAQLLQNTSEDELYHQALIRVEEIAEQGTGAVEIKSGYGLTPEAELKMLRVIKRLKETTPLTIKSTFLGAHSIPMEYRDNPSRYVDIVIQEMLPQVGEEKLADFVDVFCDRGFFSVEDTARILEAAKQYGLRPKIHANELDYSGGIQVGVAHNALSVDHLEYVGEDEIRALKGSPTMPTVLPGAAFFLNLPLSPARQMIDAGLPVAMASDYNPGSSPSGNMQLIMSLACIRYGLTPEEALNAVTINTAYAMGLEKEVGSITRGKIANLVITKEIPSLAFLPYSFGSDLVETVILNGQVF